MIKSEAQWIKRCLKWLHPITTLNCGSSTHHFRTVEQPWIEDAFYGFHVIHVDQKAAEGVNIVCNLESDSLLKVCGRTFPLIILTSVLEHVQDREAVLRNVLTVAERYVLVTVPYDWPHHPDPIDNGYRPTLATLIEDLKEYNLAPYDTDVFHDARGKCVGGLFYLRS